MDEHIEAVKKIKKLIGDYLKECAEDKKVDAGNITYVKEALSAFQKACWIIEDSESGSGGYGENRGNSGGYGRQRRSARTGRFMDGGRGMVYGWMPAPGPYYDGQDKAELAEELESIAQSGSGEMSNALREAARHLRNG